MSSTTERTIKIHLGDEVRRFKLEIAPGPYAYSTFETKVFEIFNGDDLTFKWKDSDGDMITIAIADDFNEALTEQPTGPIRLYAAGVDAGRLTSSSTVSSSPTPSPPSPPSPPAAIETEEEQARTAQAALAQAAAEGETAAAAAKQAQARTAKTAIAKAAADEHAATEAQARAAQAAAEEAATAEAQAAAEAAAKAERNAPVTHQFVSCDGSGASPLTGTRYHKAGENYDLCEAEFAKLPEPEKQLYEIVLRPGAAPLRYEPVIHYGVVCDGANASPLIGTRFHMIGADFDLSQVEFAKLDEAEKRKFELIVHPRSPPVPYYRQPEEDEGVPEFLQVLREAMAQIPQIPGGHGAVELDVSELVNACRARQQQQQQQQRCHRGQGRCARRWTDQRQEVAAGEVLPESTFGIGSFGAGVEQLQRFLIERELMSPEAIAWRAGLFGPWTRRSIATFQKTNGVSADELGRFDEATRTALLALAGEPAAEAAYQDTVNAEWQEQQQQEQQQQEQPATPTAPPAKWAAELEALNNMGFPDNEALANLLERKYGQVDLVVAELLQ